MQMRILKYNILKFYSVSKKENNMKIQKIYDHLDSLSPFTSQEKWDNSGLIVGSMDDSFDKIYIALDLDEELLNEVNKNSLIITHHPLIFSPLKTVNFDSYSTKLLQILIKKDIKLISMHTNIDKSHLNKYIVSDILGLQIEYCDDFICYANIDMDLNTLQDFLKVKLNLDFTKNVDCGKKIKRIAITTGSGMSLISSVQADCFITGDIKYHDAMEAKARDISLIDIGHYESECYFSPLLMRLLEEYLLNNKIKAIIMTSKNPFNYK